MPHTCPYQASPPVLSGKVVRKHAHSLELWGRGGLDLVQDHAVFPLRSQVHISPSAHRQHYQHTAHTSSVTPCPTVVAEHTMSAVRDRRASCLPSDTHGYCWSHSVPTLSLAVVFLTLSPTQVLEMCHHICWRVTRSFSLTHIEECGTGWAWQHRPCAEAWGFEVPLLNTYTLSWARVKKSFSQRS